jgi:hypothetical protein
LTDERVGGEMIYFFKTAVILSAYLTVTIIGAYLIKLILRKYETDLEDSGLKGAGLTIGIVERVIVLTLVLVNQYTAITIIFAAKSIARFNELTDRKMAEYYLIGTLVSIAFALITGIITRVIIGGDMI